MGAIEVGPGRFCTAAGLDLYYEVRGAGDPLVLLPGARGTIESCFGELLPALAETRQVIAVELQGHGHTPDVDRPLSYQQMAEDVGELLGALGLAAVDVNGYSMGGGVGLQLTVAHPTLVRRLVFAGGACFSPAGFHPELAGAACQGTPDDMVGTSWHAAYERVAPDPAAWPTLVAKVGQLDAGFGGWRPDEIAAISAPVLLIVGDADIARLEHVIEMFTLLAGAWPVIWWAIRPPA